MNARQEAWVRSDLKALARLRPRKVFVRPSLNLLAKRYLEPAGVEVLTRYPPPTPELKGVGKALAEKVKADPPGLANPYRTDFDVKDADEQPAQAPSPPTPPTEPANPHPGPAQVVRRRWDPAVLRTISLRGSPERPASAGRR